jgi:abortive infection bacteriophage resistance protein
MSNRKPFSKDPLSLSQQISLLEKRGMIIRDKETAYHYLKFIGYYRLSGYMHSFKNSDDSFKAGTTFDDVLNHYIFDRKLRSLFLDALERIEVAFRSMLTNIMSERHGAWWFEKKDIFVTRHGNKDVTQDIEALLQEISSSMSKKRHHDITIKHYYDNYDSPLLPPSWMVMETLSMGTVSKIFSLLKPEERGIIAATLDINEKYLVSWFRALSYVRNVCAHHARLWNRIITVKSIANRNYVACREKNFSSGRLYPQAVVIAILLAKIAPDNHWEVHLKEILASYPHDYAFDMGFPKNWNGFDLEVTSPPKQEKRTA